MKKILTLTLLMSLLFISCSSDDDSDTLVPTVAATINPPTWTQGTWTLSSGSIKGFKFTKNDFCQVLKNDVESCYIELITSHNKAYLINEVEESATAENYNIAIKLNNKSTKYHFRRGADLDTLGNYHIYWVIPSKIPEVPDTEHELINTNPILPPPPPPPATFR
ncbi:hypothetical protein [Flavobacterium sp. JP2137]|uniref:hypothetical protein n=1 Tax=Flavobacterium sp. JP2137 TaxID=3414510 RepID=UPI003D3002D7